MISTKRKTTLRILRFLTPMKQGIRNDIDELLQGIPVDIF